MHCLLLRFEKVIKEIHHFLRAHPFFVHFPIECRVTAGEDAFLSPTQGKKQFFLRSICTKGWMMNLILNGCIN